MKTIDSKTALQAIGLGTIAGMRSMSAPALAAYIFKNKPVHAIKTPLTVLAAAELIADKLPFAPARTIPVSIIVRSISGATSSTYAANKKGKRLAAGVIGLVTTIASTFAFYYLRKEAGKKLKIDNYILGLAEDLIGAGIGLSLIRLA